MCSRAAALCVAFSLASRGTTASISGSKVQRGSKVHVQRLHSSESAAAAAPPSAFVPWVLAADTELGRDIPFAGNSLQPFLGTFATEAGCRNFCATQPNCTQYTWNNISTNKLWTHRCYGRHDSIWLASHYSGCYSGRRVLLPPPPGPPPPVPPGTVQLSVQKGTPINAHLFGYDLEEWGSPLNLTYNDTAGLSLTEALHPGVLRYPSGTGSNIWDTIRGQFLPAPAGNPGGYHGWETELAPPVNGLPVGTFSGKSFLDGIGGKAKRVIWALNVYSLSAKETCEQIAYIADLPGQQAPGVLLELGNELWSSAQGLPNFPNGTAYAEAMIPIVECARKYMPNAKVGACGLSEFGWNEQLRPYFDRTPPTFDGLSIHEYEPNTPYVLAQRADERVSYVAAYSWAAAFDDAKGVHDQIGKSTPIWLTEFGFGLDKYNRTEQLNGTGGCLLEALNLSSFGALHGAFHVGRILGAINAQVDCHGAGCNYAAITFETFVYRDPAPTLFPLDWCGMPAGTVSNCVSLPEGASFGQPADLCPPSAMGQKDRPDLARVTGTGQLFAHFSAQALKMQTMHGVTVTGGPTMQFATDNKWALGDQPCIQAAAFQNGSVADNQKGVATVFAILNICNSTIAMTIAGAKSGGTVVAYSLLDMGGKAPLPVEPNQFPWPAPLSAKAYPLSDDGVFSAQPLSFAIVESCLVPHTPAPPPPPPPPPPPAPAPTPTPSPVLCSNCKKPSWSWATVGNMSFAHLSNESGAWSDEALDVLTKFPMVTIEKYQGQAQRCFANHRRQWGPPGGWLNSTYGEPWCNLNVNGGNGPGPNAGCNCTVESAPPGLTPDATGFFAEDHIRVALRQLKQRNPNISTLAYHDSNLMWTNDQVSCWGRNGAKVAHLWNPTVYGMDDTIVANHPEWCLHNTSGQFVWDSYANNHVYDHTFPEVRAAWVEYCLNLTRSGEADGCFIDGATFPHTLARFQPFMKWNISDAKASTWIPAHDQALWTLNTALGEGTLIANGGLNALASGFMIESFTPDDYSEIQAGVKAGAITQVHTSYYLGAKNPDVRDALAGFLIGAGPYAYFSGPYSWSIAQTWSDPEGIDDVRMRWLPEFDRPLGEPTTEAVLDERTGIATRTFASGTTVTFNHTNNQGTIKWSDGFVTKGPGCAPDATRCHSCKPPSYTVCI